MEEAILPVVVSLGKEAETVVQQDLSAIQEACTVLRHRP
tara:strand:- start:169 stop:285 length:117 start_codon:yes stop_codon:yes gene_type:complete